MICYVRITIVRRHVPQDLFVDCTCYTNTENGDVLVLQQFSFIRNRTYFIGYQENDFSSISTRTPRFWRVTFSTFQMFVPFLEYSIAEMAGRISYNVEYCFRMNSSFESSSYETTLIWLALGPIAKCTRKSRIKFFTISKFSFPIEPDLS